MKTKTDKLIDMNNLLEYLLDDKEITEEEKRIYLQTQEQIAQKLEEEEK